MGDLLKPVIKLTKQVLVVAILKLNMNKRNTNR
jgi:hypothetical protein